MPISRLNISPLRLLPAIVGALLLLPLLQGCGGRSRVHADLLHAESIMEEHPDSAYDILSGIRPDSAASEEDRALHALLLTQAMHKTHRLTEEGVVPLATADSMIRIAEKYFEEGNDTQRLMRVYYYRGVILALTPDNFSAALLPLTKSLELARSLDNPFWIAKCFDLMGDVFYSGNAQQDRVAAAKQALKYYELSGREDFIPWARMSLARAQISAGLNEDAVESILPVVNDTAVDRYLMGQAKETLARAYFFSDRYRECLDEINSIDSLEETMESEHPELPMFIVACYIELDSLRKGRELYRRYKSMMDSLDISILEKRFAIKESKKVNPDNYEDLYDELMEDYERTINTDLGSVLMQASSEIEARNHRRNAHLRLVILGIIFIGLILLNIARIIFITHSRRSMQDRNILLHEKNLIIQENDSVKREITKIREENSNYRQQQISSRQEIEKAKELASEYLATIRRLEKGQDTRKNDSENPQESLLNLLKRDRDAISDFLAILYEQNGDKKKAEDRFIASLNNKIHKNILTPRRLKSYEDKINQATGDMLVKLKEDFPGLTDDDKRIFIYKFMGFDPKAILYFLKIDDFKTVSQRTDYIRKVIKALPEERRKVYFPLFPTLGKATKKRHSRGSEP